MFQQVLKSRQRFILVVLIPLSILVSTVLFWSSSSSSSSSSYYGAWWFFDVSNVVVKSPMQLVSTTATTILAPSNSSHTKTPKVNNNKDDDAQMPQLDASEIVVNSSWVVMTMAMMDSSTADADVAAVDELKNTISLLKDWHFVIVVLSNQKDQNDPSVKKASSKHIIHERLFNMTSSSSNSTTHAPNRRVHILDYEVQERLGYRITKHMSSDSYARKNIGYLYAIHRGAKQILDLDVGVNVPQYYSLLSHNDQSGANSTNSTTPTSIPTPTAPASWLQKPYYLMLSRVRNDENLSHDMSLALSSTVNPLKFFYGADGHYDAHYPHDIRAFDRKHSQQYLVKMHTSLLSERRISIFQGLVHMTTTTNSNETKYPHSNEYSIVTPPGTMTAFHSRNSVFMEDAFWALFIPKVHESCRPYVIQKMLWEFDSHIQFTDAVVNASVNSTVHKYLREEMSETVHDECVSLVMRWKSQKPADNTLFAMLTELYSYLEIRGRIESGTVELHRSWLEDLTRIGYGPPACSKPRSLDTSPVNFSYQNARTLAQHRSNVTRLHKIRDNTLLIINFNHEHYKVIPMLEKMYMDTFPHRIYVGPVSRQVGHVYVHGFPTERGSFSYLGYRFVLQEFPNYEGYLITNDDVIMNTGNWIDHDENKIWVSPILNYCTFSKRACDVWFPQYYSQLRDWYHKLPTSMQDRIHSNALALAPNTVRRLDRVHIVKAMVDVFYLPHRTIAEFVRWTGVMNRVWLELGEASLMYAMDEASNLIFLNEQYLWTASRTLEVVKQRFRQKPDFVHPVKWTQPGTLNIGYELLEEQLCIFQRVNHIE